MSSSLDGVSTATRPIDPVERSAPSTDPGGGGNAEIQAFEAAVEDLLKALESQRSGGGAAGSSSPAGSSPGAGPSSSGQSNAGDSAIPGSTPAGAPSTTAGGGGGVGTGTGGQTVNIDGGNANGHGVTERVDDNTGAAATFGWENAKGQLIGSLHLQNGQSGVFDVNAGGPDATSARLIKLNPDGSIPAQSNLDEQNVALGANGQVQNSADVSEITAGGDPTKITITANGKTVGNGAPGGAYVYPTQDQQSNPANNPMTMAMDTARSYDNDFTG